MRLFQKFFGRSPSTEQPESDGFFDQYCHDLPSHQNAVDILPGWNSAFPGPLPLQAGNHALFADPRIVWAIKQAGPIENRKVLEIGPLEGMHTYMLNKHRPASIDAVEANKQCFLRCLVTKEILGMERAHFYLGDALKWLESEERHYDLAVASGVLYHMADPGYFLSQLTRRCDQLFIWTHYFDETVMQADDPRRKAFNGNVETRTFAGVPVRYYERHYFNANATKEFCGGMKDRHYWMHRDDILKLIQSLGFGDISITQEDPNHSGGPCFCLFAKRDALAKQA
ncbi:class I SAM-dependent methyltransferase [Rhizobiaceae bacterium BDR2-2]|uniref:Class I SAM-dependent methyltransferase n=1 Tax=Ectorhizobium quercum TaxID=2965071 RepID=A0AAE3SX71_9HYPH|nr:class I SAM-dependent methyltransferase [Ectorhizobium quercum]MCX8996207.1 class I SAM-dependent methyltransferase [Ectorhizobium quercum]MCX8998754.1 class I SAM-dependent methyltransferase [Ectorhizobium quercum]